MRKLYSLNSLAIMLFSILAINVSAQVSTVYGTFSYHNDGIRVLPNVTVLLYDQNGELTATTTTDENGYYELNNLPNGSYTLTGSYDLTPGGIYVIDALLVANHVTGINQLNGVSSLAADVDGDGDVTWDDYNAILFGYLVNGNPFPAGGWKFEKVSFELDEMKASNSEKGVGGSSTGDVAGAFDPAIAHTPIHFFASNQEIFSAPGEELLISIKANESIDLAAMHMIIDYPSHLVEILGAETELQNFQYLIKDNQITISAADASSKAQIFRNGDALITLRVRTTEAFSTDNAIRFGLNDESHFAGGNLEKISPKLTLPLIKVKEGKSEIMANYPNPFSIQTKVDYYVASPSFVNISVLGMDGRLITTLVNEYHAEGIYQIEFKRGHLAPGAYLMRMQTEGLSPAQNTRVMIITSD